MTAVVNRLWTLWCELSGTDPGDSRQKMAFNTDRRVTALSAHATELVKGFAIYVWSADPGMSQHDFLDQWLAAVNDDQRRREAVVAREREEAERRRKAEEEARHRELQAAKVRRQAEARARRSGELERAAVVRSQVDSLYNITSVANLARIASRGILCHDLAADISHDDLSDRGVQDRREGRIVDGTPLHRFANLYFNPRNAMLYRLHKYEGRDVVVLQVSAEVLDQPGVVVFDGNAASGGSQWWPASEGLARIDLDRIRSRTWRDAAGETNSELKRITQAEVLVPRMVAPRFIEGFLAPTQEVLDRAGHVVGHWRGRVDRQTFFDG